MSHEFRDCSSPSPSDSAQRGNMRILLQNIRSKHYYQGRGQWTSDRSDAFDFQFAGGAPECLEELDLLDVELMVESDQRQPAESF
jgi:hypothetical protein